MGAELVDEAVAPESVAESNQALGQNLHAHRRTIVLRQFLGEEHRQPVATEKVTHLGTRSGLGNEIVLFFGKHLALLSLFPVPDGAPRSVARVPHARTRFRMWKRGERTNLRLPYH